MVWTITIKEGKNNEFIWDNIITDSLIIEEYLSNNTPNAIIEGTPSSAKIVSVKDNYVYNINNTWEYINDSWSEVNKFQIFGNPNALVKIIPASLDTVGYDYNIKQFNENGSTLLKEWEIISNDFSSILSKDENILYIDKETSNGYKYNGSNFEEVLFFKKANKVYEITSEEFEYMVENGLVKPAFKNSVTIFEDVYSNIFLL